MWLKNTWQATLRICPLCECSTCTSEGCREDKVSCNAPWTWFQDGKVNALLQILRHRWTKRWALYSYNANRASTRCRCRGAFPRPLVFHHLAGAWKFIRIYPCNNFIKVFWEELRPFCFTYVFYNNSNGIDIFSQFCIAKQKKNVNWFPLRMTLLRGVISAFCTASYTHLLLKHTFDTSPCIYILNT